jgi:hypothetical protein
MKPSWRFAVPLIGAAHGGVVFLDPYGLQVTWDTLVAIAKTKALDLWVLFPSGMGLNRLLTKSGDIPQEWRDTLDRSLGTQEWRSAFYRNEGDPDLFDGARSKTVKDADPMKLEKFYLDRLRRIFPTVMNNCIRLTNSKDQTMYLLCFACANPSPKAKALVVKLVGSAANITNGGVRHRMDGGNVESDRRLLGALARLHQLLCHAHGSTSAGDGHGEMRRHHAQVGQAPCLDRAREC